MRRAFLTCMLVVVFATAVIAQPDSASFRGFLEDYARAVLAADSVSTRDAWWPGDLHHSERLGLRYSGPIPKIDGASLLASAASTGRDKATAFEVTTLPDLHGHSRVRIHPRGGASTDETIYYGFHDGERWWLRHGISVFSADWPVDQSHYLRILRHPDLAPNPIAVERMDQFVEDAAARLGLGATELETLAAKRFDWLLAPDETVRELVGTATEGVANLQMDAVISQHHFHPHELAHLLIHLALAEQPDSTLPAYQEGFAVWMGGRYNSSAAMQLELGALFLENNFVQLRELLPFSSFRMLPADMSYAASAVLVGMLQDQLGTNDFLEFYRAHSGEFERVSSWTSPRLLNSLATALRCEIEDLDGLVRRYVASRAQVTFRSGADESNDESTHDDGAMIHARWSTVGRDIHLILSAESEEKLRGGFLWSARLPSVHKSELFAEHFPQLVHQGERYALVFGPGEIGLYDYALDILVAKRADGFAPDERFWNAENAELRLRVAIDQLPEALGAAKLYSQEAQR